MKYIFMAILVTVLGCEELPNDRLIQRCNGDTIETLLNDEWVMTYDCQKYLVQHSGVICPRTCCPYENTTQVTCCVNDADSAMVPDSI